MTAEEIIEKHKDYLKNNDLTGFYRALVEDKSIFGAYISEVTQYFYEMGADPLEYMDKIPKYFLCGADIESFTIPSYIKEIGWGAFYLCKNLKSIEIPDGVTEIGGCAFWCCSNLKSIKLPDSLEKIDNCAFENCKNLTDINVPNNLKRVKHGAFIGCAEEIQEKFREFMQ